MYKIIFTGILALVLLIFLVILLMEVFRMSHEEDDYDSYEDEDERRAGGQLAQELPREKKEFKIPFKEEQTELTYPVYIYVNVDGEEKNGKKIYTEYLMTKPKIKIGRSEKCDIQIDRPDVGNVQAVIERGVMGSNLWYKLSDVGKTNNIEYLAKDEWKFKFMKRKEPVILEGRDVFYIGNTKIMIKTPTIGHELTAEEKENMKAGRIGEKDYTLEDEKEYFGNGEEQNWRHNSVGDGTKNWEPRKKKPVEKKRSEGCNDTMRRIKPDDLRVEEVRV